MKITLDNEPPSPLTLWEAARCGLNPTSRLAIVVTDLAWRRIADASALVDQIVAEQRAVYGINTGVGGLAGIRILPENIKQQQVNVLRSHCCGVGESLPRDIVLGMWLLRLNTIFKGHSGTRSDTVRTLIRLLEAGVLAVVPSRGSVGASGDLCPSAHAALILIGEGFCTVPVGDAFRQVQARDALKQLSVEPLRLQAKEALSLINGTQLSTALALKAWYECRRLVGAANFVAAMTIEALDASRDIFNEQVLALAGHAGVRHCGREMAAWLEGPSEIRDGLAAVRNAQGPYSLRCAPQVHGAVWDDVTRVEAVLADEVNAVADNPLLFADTGTARTCGNFHAIYCARACDTLATAMTTLASISERRTALLMDSRHTGLPDFLIGDGGVRSGLMMSQVTAAALVSECKTLCFPASVDSVSTNSGQEDHVSMGPTAGFKALAIIEKVRWVLAIELLAALQAVDLRLPTGPSARLENAQRLVRTKIPQIIEDRVLSDDIHLIARMIEEDGFREC